MCPKCKSAKTEVYDSRKIKKHGGLVRRRRSCLKCFKNWTTYEISAEYLNELTNSKKIIESLKKIENSASKIAEDVKGLLPANGDTLDSDADIDDDNRDIL
jgi:transcriptional regulator NrdR family protein